MESASTRIQRILASSGAVAQGSESKYTSHSFKDTTLSWSKQLDIRKDFCKAQGHHRYSISGNSVAKYSRDDVFDQLRCQELLIRGIAGGFRPAEAQLRGACAPLPEPFEFQVPVLHDKKLELGVRKRDDFIPCFPDSVLKPVKNLASSSSPDHPAAECNHVKGSNDPGQSSSMRRPCPEGSPGGRRDTMQMLRKYYFFHTKRAERSRSRCREHS